MGNILNISAYLFVPLSDLPNLRQQIFEQARQYGLLGTILLAPEGINLFLAGEPVSVRAMVAYLQSDTRFAALVAKESTSSGVPFRKLQVKIKTEIIRMNHPLIQPAHQRAAAVVPIVLARWLTQGHDDDGRPVVMLDTRNGFEVAAGHFKGALHWELSKFTDFPQAAQRHQAALAGKRVVSYCTGGIRCEKAALYLAELGTEHVVQLEGGILQYFAEVGASHFEGHCFVFDERFALNASLQEATNG